MWGLFELSGVPLGTLASVGGVAAALVVLLYILKLRRRPVAVPFALLWERVLRDREASTLFAHLKRVLSLLLQLLLLALLLLALGDPRLGPNLVEGRNLVVLVDSSASMKATDVSPTRLAVAQREVRELIAGLGGADRMLVAQLDATVTPLTTMTGEVSILESGVDALRATDTRADLATGVRYALDTLRGATRAQIVLVGDGAYPELDRASRMLEGSNVEVSFVPVGAGQRNLAITGFSVRRYPLDKSRHEVMLEVTNTNEEPAEAELTLLGDGQVVDVTRLKLGAKERLPRYYPDLGGASRTLEALLRFPDGQVDQLPADDHGFALMPERRRSRILVVTRGNTYLEAALLLDEYLDVTSIRPEQYPPQQSFDVTIFDGVAPPLAKNTGGSLYLDPPDGEHSPVERGQSLEMFGFDSWDEKSPILRWMAMENIQVATGRALRPASGDRVLGASVLGPILVEGRRAGRRFVALGFDPRQSDFVLRVGWPLFILNAINSFVEEDTEYLSSYRTGEVWHIPAPSEARAATLVDPLGLERLVPVKEGRAIYFGDQAGFYELTVGRDGDRATSSFAANLLDSAESQIEPVARLELGGRRAEAPSGFHTGVRRELWLYLLLGAIGLSALEWFTYHRRVTV